MNIPSAINYAAAAVDFAIAFYLTLVDSPWWVAAFACCAFNLLLGFIFSDR